MTEIAAEVKTIRVRFAPSPTGFLHIGGARTALFNWMYARSQNGIFVLRIEDTDAERSKQEYLEEILASMEWLGLKGDEFYKQSDRFSIYRQYAQKLLDEGKAYKDGEAVILKNAAIPDGTAGAMTSVKWFDLIRGEIQFEVETLKDQVLMKSDGTPTYSFACVIDDSLMNITHVIRGEDHISNTPKQILMYHALGLKPPKFAHLPLIMDEEGGRMSKRAGAVAVTEYRGLGFLPEAIVNYLMLLGWSPGNNQEKVNMPTALKNFSIKKINKAGAAFSMDKLKWLNMQYIKEAPLARLTDLVLPVLKAKGIHVETLDRAWLEMVVKLYQPRMQTLVDFLEWTAYLFNDEVVIAQEEKNKHLTPTVKTYFVKLVENLQALSVFDAKSAEEAFRRVVAELGIPAGDLVHPVRIALTGNTVGPGLFETMAVLGKEKTIRRLRCE